MMTACETFQPFTIKASEKDYSSKALKAFLQQRGLYGNGLWKHVHPKTWSKGLKFGTMIKDPQPFVMARESAILQSPISAHLPHDQPLENWSQYYTIRGFEMDSLICGVLHYPLTLYWIITNQMAKLYPARFENMRLSGSLNVHVIGAEKEADMFPAFLECGRLLFGIRLQMHLFGNEISKQVDGRCESEENLIFQLHSGLYHECDHQQLEPPDVVIGFNAGLGAYPSFIQTIQTIVANQTPFFCTDYCYESVIHSKQMLEDMEVGKITGGVKNPFHGPFPKPVPGLEDPCYDNAFVFSVQGDVRENESSKKYSPA